ncbi:MAG TPA: hypothetical protein GX404_03395 [Syntrophomonadaceae bacterium]|nr:hypothetical protein [Syntrophomonadaceae bacterium]
MVSKLALSHPDISFSYSNEKKRYFKTSGSGKIEETVAEIYGLNYLQQYLDVNWQGSRYRVQGLISRPEIRKTHRRMQTFFVNNRLVRSPVLMRALEEAYRGLLLSREYPMAILFLDCPPELVDVNVHPQKAEVKFQDAGEVYRVFYHAIKNKLADYSYRLDDKAGGAAAAGDDSPAESGYTDQPSVSLRPDERIYEPSLSFPVTEGAVVQSASVFSALINEEQFEERSPYTIIGQFDHAYILVQQEQELLLIDQHAAHEKILFNKLQEKILNKQAIAQTMAFPEQLSISVKQMELFEQHADLFPSIGFEIEAIGPEALVIRAAPGFARGQEAVIVSELLEFLEEHPVVEFFHHALSTIACKSAIKAGQRLNMQQMQQVVTELLTSAEWKNCPHGRPTVLQISREELDRRFKR